MKLQGHPRLLGGVLLVASCAIFLSGCMGFGGGGSNETTTTAQHARVATTLGAGTDTSLADAGGAPVVITPADKYSSFQSKDPFVQQQVPDTDTTEASTSSTAAGTTTTTATTTSSSTSSTTTTSSTSTTSTSSSTTSTTSFFTHILEVDTIAADGEDVPAVTFQVDSTAYEGQHKGDTVSTSWGSVYVADINLDALTVTLLLDGKSVTLSEHQILFE
jgi:hypothetical protein